MSCKIWPWWMVVFVVASWLAAHNGPHNERLMPSNIFPSYLRAKKHVDSPRSEDEQQARAQIVGHAPQPSLLRALAQRFSKKKLQGPSMLEVCALEWRVCDCACMWVFVGGLMHMRAPACVCVCSWVCGWCGCVFVDVSVWVGWCKRVCSHKLKCFWPLAEGKRQRIHAPQSLASLMDIFNVLVLNWLPNLLLNCIIKMAVNVA